MAGTCRSSRLRIAGRCGPHRCVPAGDTRLFTAWTDDDLRMLGDFGYEGEPATIIVAFKKPKNAACTDVQQEFNRAHNAVRAIGERGNSLLKTTFIALRNVSLCPWSIGRITAAALVTLHTEHGRTP